MTLNQFSTMIQAALAGGREILRVYSGDIAVSLKEDDTPLTKADRRSHDVIVAALRESDPDTPVLSEEGEHAPFVLRKEWSEYYLIDPLDGTKEFIKRNGEFTVNIALMKRENGHAIPVAGIVYAPVPGTVYAGVTEQPGAWRVSVVNEETRAFLAEDIMQKRNRIPSSLDQENRPFTIVASRSHMSRETEAYIHMKRKEHPDLALITAGSSLKLCRVAEGSADEYPRFAPTMEWDTAAGDAIARACGCAVVAWKNGPGGPLVYNKKDLRNPWFLVHREA